MDERLAAYGNLPYKKPSSFHRNENALRQTTEAQLGSISTAPAGTLIICTRLQDARNGAYIVQVGIASWNCTRLLSSGGVQIVPTKYYLAHWMPPVDQC